jgi:hypothetical protein
MDKEQTTKLYINAYRSFLKAQGRMGVDQIEGLYKQMTPSIHKKAHLDDIDVEGFMYAYLRLPPQIHKIKEVILSQIGDIFLRAGYKIDYWEAVSAPARRRKMYFDGDKSLAVFINSVTDLDDMVGLLTAFSIEWNKINQKLSNFKGDIEPKNKEAIKKTLGIDDDNWDRLSRILTDNLFQRLSEIKDSKVNFSIRLLKGSFVDYKKATQRWFENILQNTEYKDLRSRPLYFVSSNTHSLVNNITGWVNELEDELVQFLKDKNMTQFLKYWDGINKGELPGSKENFLWYILKKYEAENPDSKTKREAYERNLGIETISAEHYLDINAQLLSLDKIKNAPGIKKMIGLSGDKFNSDGLILNIDYPLGSGAYMVLSTLLQNVNQLKGVYILGKASFLHANIGDIGIPSKVFDTYTNNTYIFKNSFTASDFDEFKAGSVLTGQGVVSTKGTFLHPENVIQQYFIDGYTIVEMEDGPYLSAIYEASHFSRYPEKETIELLNNPIDLGIIHYASDTPFTKAITLGTRNLGYEGVEATYISSLVILKRIVSNELS